MVQLAPPTVVWAVLGTLWIALLIPVAIMVAPPLIARLRGARAAPEAATS
jgi:hypothetical protein